MNLEWREHLERAIALLSGLVGEGWCSDVFRAAARAELVDLERALAEWDDALHKENEAPSASMSEESRREEFGSGNGWHKGEN
jgi:hypothetical protein